jgi:hypothetical protein
MKLASKLIFLLTVAALATVTAVCLNAQMASPSIDRPDRPFSYFSHPTDEIGIMDAEAGTEITPEGYLRTGFGELMFFVGPELEPTSVRIRTLEAGHLPIVHYDFERDGVAYSFTIFTATLDGKPEGTLINFIRIAMKNRSAQPNRAMAQLTAIIVSTVHVKASSLAITANWVRPSTRIGSTPFQVMASFEMAGYSIPILPDILPAVLRSVAITILRMMRRSRQSLL